ncbi:hypothetical protein [Paenibacillus sp. J2TS4]|uniref:hypothetical protein n=1 Tax=Paenibacillus sp. J2TS4 TaxID=2807194 RepID=UPI001BD06A7B|nr:hypothetical protein [Paenibacillus sp. J2TS4]
MTAMAHPAARQIECLGLLVLTEVLIKSILSGKKSCRIRVLQQSSKQQNSIKPPNNTHVLFELKKVYHPHSNNTSVLFRCV